MLKLPDLLRYGVWGLVAFTANANRRYYRMSTTWLPHLLTNSLTLLLPDILRLIWPRRRKPANFFEAVLAEMARDNDHYVIYVIPLAAGYILSHPDFNIFKGEMAEIRLAGFGLDALPHGATGFALTALVCDTLETACQVQGTRGPLRRLAEVCNRSPGLTSFAVLGLLTAGWEYAEYRVHYYELAQRGDISRINMMWSAKDTAYDTVSNFLGWAAAMLLRRRGRL